MSRIERISDECSGNCPRCGDRPAFAMTAPGLGGYFDSCAPCAPQVAVDALGAEHEPDERELRRKRTLARRVAEREAAALWIDIGGEG